MPPCARQDAGRRVTRLAVCPLYTDNWATLAMAAAWLAKARDPTEVITRLFPAPEPAQRTRTEQVMCPDTAPPARARAGRTASCARLCTLWPLPLPQTGEDVHATDRPHTPRHRVRTLPLWPLVWFPTHGPFRWIRWCCGNGESAIDHVPCCGVCPNCVH